MIKLTVLVKRKPGMGIDEFHAAWRAHGRLIAEEPAFHEYIRRYEQHHRTIDDYRSGDTFDGMALQWFESFDDFVAMVGDPVYAEKLAPDEDRLFDMANLVVIFTDEAETFIA